MPGPLWLGVGGTLHRRRARPPVAPGRPRPGRPRPARPAVPWLTFVVATLTLSWLTIAIVGPLDASSPLAAAVGYACALGWQPVVVTAALRWLGVGPPPPPRPPRPAHPVLEALGVIAACTAAAALVAWLAGERGAHALFGSPGALAAAAILLGQAALEEYGWRGDALDWAVARWGPRRGVVVHAIAWALGYVPLGVAAAPAVAPMIALLATLFAATTIGVLLGALRLRGGRVVPAALANAAMTITAGLPMVLA